MATPSGTTVAKWGNAPAIRIPKSVMQKANLREGDAVDVGLLIAVKFNGHAVSK